MQSGALHFMTLGTVELQAATIPLRWRLVHRRGRRRYRGPRTCIPAERVAVGKSRCCMECSAPTQAAEIKETLQLLVVRVPSRWRPDHGRDGGRCRCPRTHPVAERRIFQQRFSCSEVLLGVLSCSHVIHAPCATPHFRTIADPHSYTFVLVAGDTVTAKTTVSGHFPDVLDDSRGLKC